ncbi:HlyD family efflux transporter periplasmic adaptor subunit [Paralimibaculum aggregatum]|uniref:Membrane fusion protein (MFP) family protein n=1 Tax=Paralimibaculum aggregatum TaxID=3036245 RepID=A0ABQ6LNK5_9RHOB|nr:HlyD family type I secretion periplasmic adaptor subunit [Limibaculum sp. NKW23]GMG82011.1 HlyD family efflux transporter periplasmic adaptor subunit [Limibaculum sp. NKW23]
MRLTRGPRRAPPQRPLPLDADGAAAAGRSRRVLGFGSLAFVLLIAIAGVAEIREIAVARGQTVPLTAPVAVEHLEGGRIAQLLVEEGDLVQPGTVILMLDRIAAAAELAQLESRRAALALQRRRLSALLTGETPDFSATPPRYAAFAAEQAALFRAERSAHEAAQAAARAELAELANEIAAAETEIASDRARVEIAASQLAMREQVFARGHTSRDLVFEASLRLEHARADLAEAVRVRAGAARARAQATARAEQLRVDAVAAWAADSAETAHRTAVLDEQIKQAEERVEQLVVISPIRGLVHELSPRGRGEVLLPGETIARIVPASAGLVAEVRASPADIGHVAVGDPATVTVDTFDREGFGELRARVESISATTFETAEAELYYKIRLRLAEGEGRRGQLRALLPGMTVEAQILTGGKSILRYLARPFIAPFERAFSER